MTSSFATGTRIQLRLLIVVLAATVLFSACGGSDGNGDNGRSSVESVLAAVGDLRGDARQKKLLEVANEAGGEMSLYTSMSSGDESEVAGAFEDAYGLDVSVYRANAETVHQRLAEEAEAGFQGADIVDTDGLELTLLTNEGLLAEYRSPNISLVVPRAGHGTWTTTRFNTYVVSWNSKLVGPGEQPRSWAELADPRWKGKLVLEVGDFDWYATLREYWLEQERRSKQEVDGLFEAIARNATFVRGHTLMEQLVVAGEFHVAGANYGHIVRGFVKEGAPIELEPLVQPIFTRAGGVGVLEDAPNPAAALLYVDWMLSDGQDVIKELERDAARKDLVTVKDVKEVSIDFEALASDHEAWSKSYEQLVAVGTVREEDS